MNGGIPDWDHNVAYNEVQFQNCFGKCCCGLLCTFTMNINAGRCGYRSIHQCQANEFMAQRQQCVKWLWQYDGVFVMVTHTTIKKCYSFLSP